MRYGLARSAKILQRESELAVLRERYARLSPREREVMELVLRGYLNKQVGGELGISVITVKAHRGKAIRKMAARCLAQLVNMSMILGQPDSSAPATGAEICDGAFPVGMGASGAKGSGLLDRVSNTLVL